MWDSNPVGALYLSAVLVGVMAGMALQTQMQDIKNAVKAIRRYIHESSRKVSGRKMEDGQSHRR